METQTVYVLIETESNMVVGVQVFPDLLLASKTVINCYEENKDSLNYEANIHEREMIVKK